MSYRAVSEFEKRRRTENRREIKWQDTHSKLQANIAWPKEQRGWIRWFTVSYYYWPSSEWVCLILDGEAWKTTCISNHLFLSLLQTMGSINWIIHHFYSSYHVCYCANSVRVKKQKTKKHSKGRIHDGLAKGTDLREAHLSWSCMWITKSTLQLFTCILVSNWNN